MDFSSANVPISKDTWAPSSPPPTNGHGNGNGNGKSEDAAPRSRSGSPPPRPSYNKYERDDYRERPADQDSRSPRPRGDAPEDRPRPPARDYERPSGYGNGYSGGSRGGDFGGPPRPRHAPAAVEPGNVLGVFGLSIRTRERDLEDEFNRCGEVEKVVIVYDQRSDRSRGFGFITMRSVEDAQRCIDKLNGVSLQGRAIRVDFSATRKPHNPTPGQYMGERRPMQDERYPPRDFDRRDDRRSGGYDRYDDRDRGDRGGRRDDEYRPRNDDRGDRYERKRSSSPGGYRRSRQSPVYEDRRAPPPARDYDDAVPAGDVSSMRY